MNCKLYSSEIYFVGKGTSHFVVFDQNLICLLMKKMLVQNLVLWILYWKSVAAFAFAWIIKVLNFNMIFKEILWESITLRLTKNCILKKELLHKKNGRYPVNELLYANFMIHLSSHSIWYSSSSSLSMHQYIAAWWVFLLLFYSLVILPFFLSYFVLHSVSRKKATSTSFSVIEWKLFILLNSVYVKSVSW